VLHPKAITDEWNATSTTPIYDASTELAPNLSTFSFHRSSDSRLKVATDSASPRRHNEHTKSNISLLFLTSDGIPGVVDVGNLDDIKAV